MFKHTVEVKLSFIETKEVNSKGNKVKVPVVHRTLHLEGGPEPVGGITHYRVKAYRRGGETKFSVSYVPAPVKEFWWEHKAVEQVDWKREVEPNGKVTPGRDLEGILKWLKFRVADPVAVLTDLLTAVPVKETKEAA